MKFEEEKIPKPISTDAKSKDLQKEANYPKLETKIHAEEEEKTKPKDLKDEQTSALKNKSPSKACSNNTPRPNYSPKLLEEKDKLASPSKPPADLEIDSFLASKNVTFDFSKDEGKN